MTSIRRLDMLKHTRRFTFSTLWALAAVALFATPAIAQNAAQTNDALKQWLSIQVEAWGERTNKPVPTATSQSVATLRIPATAPTPELFASNTKPADEPKRGKDVEAELEVVKEQLRIMQEGQKILIEQLDSMRRELRRARDTSNGKPALTMADASGTAANPTDIAADADADADADAQAGVTKQAREERYQ